MPKIQVAGCISHEDHSPLKQMRPEMPRRAAACLQRRFGGDCTLQSLLYHDHYPYYYYDDDDDDYYYYF